MPDDPLKPPQEEVHLKKGIHELDQAFLKYWHSIERMVDNGQAWALWRLFNAVFNGTEKLTTIALSDPEHPMASALRSIAARCEAWPAINSPAPGLYPEPKKIFEALKLGCSIPSLVDPGRRYVRDVLGALMEELMREIGYYGLVYRQFFKDPDRTEDLASLPSWAAEAARAEDVPALASVVIQAFDDLYPEQIDLDQIVEEIKAERKKENKPPPGPRYRQRGYLHSKIVEKLNSFFFKC